MTGAGASRQGECARRNERPGAANDRIVHAFMLHQQRLRVTICSGSASRQRVAATAGSDTNPYLYSVAMQAKVVSCLASFRR
jgi:hypothetical protein